MTRLLHEELEQHFDALFLKRARTPVGALFSMVLRHTKEGTLLIGGKVRFSDEQLEARATIQHPKITLVEEWVPDGKSAVLRLLEILTGHGKVASFPISDIKSDARIESTGGWRKGQSGWREWHIESRPEQTIINNAAEPPREAIITAGAPPFLSGAHAVREWLINDRDAWKADSPPANGNLLTILPDSRIRITNATWRDSLLTLELDIKVSEQPYEVQAFYAGSKTKRDDIVKAAPSLQLEIPAEVESIYLFIIDTFGEVLVEHHLPRSEAKLTTSVVSISNEERVTAELRSGENEFVEFKPFVEAKDQTKEAELVKTVVAFSNTQGGRLYVGVDDNGVPQGLSELKKMTKRTEDNVEIHLKSAIDRLHHLLRTNIKLIPQYDVEVHDKEGRPVIIVNVKRGDHPPYATAQNEYFVRHGSSSMRPEPDELRRLLSRESSYVVSWTL
ncbi:ATP-binding protein [Myxococcus sp. K38C18041901]|uniref:AlbA family DNA-binding domain-containing protein n=1 Tax=Myxococcus guangdongensis TaxID=2906760 RepID=UPI0020A7C7D9|nr:ATP-binding protein [Myxococcus guangdongensis]MCP3063702.1 ATP-binding protein [Myxococcus guangdongensis]